MCYNTELSRGRKLGECCLPYSNCMIDGTEVKTAEKASLINIIIYNIMLYYTEYMFLDTFLIIYIHKLAIYTYIHYIFTAHAIS